MTFAKPYKISKRLVWESYKKVKANRGAAGIDEQSIEEFEENLSRNLYKLWNRMASGSYFPPSVKVVEIPKKSGGKRRLGVPTVADRIAQGVVKLALEPHLDPQFHRDSYGYRPRKSAKDAIRVTRSRCWKYDWVVEFDIKGAFDNIDHNLLLILLKKHTTSKWILLYVERWLKSPFEHTDGRIEQRQSGTPQGGIVSPLLMNLFLHYVFDQWMEREHPQCPFARYADDAVVHCHTQAQAEEMVRVLHERFARWKLTLHPDKTRVVYCKDSNRKQEQANIQFTFLGFTFKPRRAKSRTGIVFTSFLPGASQQSISRMKQEIRRWHIPIQSAATIEELSKRYNAALRGWWNYFGEFYRTGFWNVFLHVDAALARWGRRKFKRLHRHIKRSHAWVHRVAYQQPKLFVHWQHLHMVG